MTHHRFLAVHTLKVKGLASAEDLAEATGVSDLAPVLDALVAEELVKLRTGRVGGYTLTKAGREAHLELLATEVDDAERAAPSRPTPRSCRSTPGSRRCAPAGRCATAARSRTTTPTRTTTRS